MVEDEFGAAADSVNKSAGAASPEVAGVFYEKRKYPFLPEGEYTAICCKTEVKDGNPNSEFYREGEKKIHLRWQIQNDRTTGKAIGYPDSEDDSKVQNFMVFNKPLSISFGDRAALQKLWKQLTGLDSEPFATKTPKKIPLGNGKFKEGTYIVFPHKYFENMTCSLMITHQEYNGKMRPNIDSYSVSPQQRDHNRTLLPADQLQAMGVKLGAAPAQPQATPPAPQQPAKADIDFLGSAPQAPAVPPAAAGITPIHEAYKSDIKEKDLPF